MDEDNYYSVKLGILMPASLAVLATLPIVQYYIIYKFITELF